MTDLSALAVAGSFRKLIRGRRGLAALLLAIPALLAGIAPAAASTFTAHLRSAVPAYCDAGGAKLWANLATCGWPGKRNTGPDLAQCPHHKLVPRGNHVTPFLLNRPGEVIKCADLLGQVTVMAPNITIKNSEVEAKNGSTVSGSAAITIDVGASATISHVTVNGGNSVHACVWHQGTQLTIKAMNCFGANDGVFTWVAKGDPARGGGHFTVSDSYFHGFTKETANGHDDGYQTEGTSHGLITHNTFEMNANATSAVAIWNSRESSTNITVSKNLMTGGGFAVYAEDYNPGTGAPGDFSAAGGFSVRDIHFTDNSFSTFAAGCVGKYGVWFTRPTWVPYQGGPTDGWHRLGNVVLETAEKINSGNPHNNGQLCA